MQKESSLNLGNKIKFLREFSGISQEAMAANLNISQQSYQKIESGNTKLTFDRLEEISDVLKVPLDVILNFNPSNYLNNCTNSNVISTTNHFHSEKLIEYYEEKINLLNDIIKQKEDEISFLRDLIKNK